MAATVPAAVSRQCGPALSVAAGGWDPGRHPGPYCCSDPDPSRGGISSRTNGPPTDPVHLIIILP